MKGNVAMIAIYCMFILGCSKSQLQDAQPGQIDNTPDTETGSFVTYVIPKGQNYVNGNTYPPFEAQSLAFEAILDSSCIYETADPDNQADINKLYGFSDNGSHHQVNSARFGWNWKDETMHIHAYCYVNGERVYKELGTVDINESFEGRIDVLPGEYVFTLNGQSDTLQRGGDEPVARGYKLVPYFGGDEPAPHEVHIQIREI